MSSYPPPPPPYRPPTPPPDPVLSGRLGRPVAQRPPTSDRRASGPATPPGGQRPRRHAAKGSRAAALALSVGTTLALAAYLERLQPDTGVDGTAAGASDATAAGAGEAATTQATTAPPTTESTTARATDDATDDVEAISDTSTAATTSTGLADGTYTGDTSMNRWGPVQVQITVNDGLITDVTTLQFPDGDRKSIAINNQAIPWLIEATLAAQNADVDTISGATYTSESYRESLQSAIDDAQAAATA